MNVQTDPDPQTPAAARETIGQRLRRWLFAPSPKITETDQRRQATLLRGLVFSLIVVAALAEAATLFLIDWDSYTGYRQTLVTVVALAVVYALSRTHRIQLAASLAVVVASAAVFLAGLGEPRGVLGGLFDFLIVPLWMGSLFIRSQNLLVLIGASLAGLLVFPYFAPGVSLDDILVGPFTFVLSTSLLLLVITRHRDRLEADRRVQLVAEEEASRREAARAGALLRVAHRLNAQLDQEAVLSALCEEVARAVNTPVAIVALYDTHLDHFSAATGLGLPLESIRKLPPWPRASYDAMLQRLGSVFAVPDLRAQTSSAYLASFRDLELSSLAFAVMEYEQEFIGSLCALTIKEQRIFTRDELLLLQGLADQAALALVNTRLYKDAQRRLDHLQALRTIDIAIATNRNLQQTLHVLLEKIVEQLKVDAAVFLLLDAQRQQLEFAASMGFRTNALRFTSLRPGEGLAGRAAMEETIISHDLKRDPQTLSYAPMFGLERFVTYFAAPLIAQGQVKGVLELFTRTPLTPDDEWLSFFEALAGQAAIAIESTTLFTDLQRINAELSRAYDSTIEGWSHALDLRDHETEGHTQRVTKMTMALATAIGLKPDELVHVRRGSLLHDIGKMGVPDQILNKPGPLSADEWEIMRKHPSYAHELLSPIAYLRPALEIPYCHHEKWDGTGYPRGLKAEQIPLSARIFAVVDVFDALTSDRPYRKAWTVEDTCEYIRDLAGSQFDPNVVEHFMELVAANGTAAPFEAERLT